MSNSKLFNCAGVAQVSTRLHKCSYLLLSFNVNVSEDTNVNFNVSLTKRLSHMSDSKLFNCAGVAQVRTKLPKYSYLVNVSEHANVNFNVS